MTTISRIAYALPEETATVQELAAAGQLQSDPSLLERFGFASVCTSVTTTPFDLALTAARKAISGIEPASVDLLLYAGPQGPTAFTVSPTAAQSSAAHRTTARFQFPGTRLQHELGLESASVLGVDQAACTTMFGAIRIARSLCVSEGLQRVLCVGAEFFPADAGREALFNCTSDAAVALIVDNAGEKNRIVAAHEVTKGYYWDADALRNEQVASYFPTARHVIAEVVRKAGWTMDQVDWIIPHNVSRRSWDVLLGLLNVPAARLWDCNIARIGHTLAGDNFINLADALDAGSVLPGQKLVLFSYGYGAHWTALALEA